MGAVEKRKLIAIMALTALLTGLSFFWREKRLADSRVLLPEPDTVSAAVQRQEITVDVGGAVSAPGLYRLPPGSRVQDAVKQAGGLLPEADRERANFARLCTDGARVHIPYKKAPPANKKASRRANPADRAPLAINSASEADLVRLPGIGPGLAKRIVAYREKHGPFRTIGQLKDVGGIGEAKFAQIKALIRL